jgi:phospholipid-transporting ATPase
MPQLWYGFNNHFSSASIYDPFIYQLYNVVFTSFPIIVYAIFDQQYSKSRSLKEPHLYSVGLNNELFNVKAISIWFICPTIYACVLAYINYFSLEESLDNSGSMFDMMGCGMAIFV